MSLMWKLSMMWRTNCIIPDLMIYPPPCVKRLIPWENGEHAHMYKGCIRGMFWLENVYFIIRTAEALSSEPPKRVLYKSARTRSIILELLQ